MDYVMGPAQFTMRRCNALLIVDRGIHWVHPAAPAVRAAPVAAAFDWWQLLLTDGSFSYQPTAGQQVRFEGI